MRLIIILSSFLVACTTLNKAPYIQGCPISNCREAETWIYRGGQPDYAGMKYLSGIGVTTIIDLNNDEREIAAERTRAKELGIDFYSIPLSGFWGPSDKDIKDILSLLADPTKKPVYLHCAHGEDRTGLVVGLYRVRYEGWSKDDAYAEMLENGFHKILIPLNNYFWDWEEL